MRKRAVLLSILIVPALAATATAGLPTGPTVMLAQNATPDETPKPTDAEPPNGVNTQDDNAAPSDWAAPTEPRLDGPDSDEPPAKTGTYGLPTLEMRPATDSTATDAAADTDLAPRVDLAGPGTPKWKVIVYVSQTTKLDDNIYISHSGKKSDVSFTASPGFAVGWGDFRSALLQHATGFADQYQRTLEPVTDPLSGDFVYIDYTANASHYLSHDSLDAVDQDAGLNAQWDFSKMLVTLAARVQTLSGPDIDLGTRARRTIYDINTSAQYGVSDKTTMNFYAGGEASEFPNALNSSDWHAQMYVDYQWFPKTQVGLGVVGGVRTLETTPNQYYQQLQARATYSITDRLSAHANGGVEVDEATGGGTTKVNPVFGLGVTYNFSDTDQFTLDASRSTNSSAVTSGQTSETTQVTLGFHHRLLSRFSMEVNGGYTHSDYYNEGLSTQVRTDDYFFVKPMLAYDFAAWSQVALAYEYHRDMSTDLPFDFAENIASLQFNFVF